jgi:hypothetical protein
MKKIETLVRTLNVEEVSEMTQENDHLFSAYQEVSYIKRQKLILTALVVLMIFMTTQVKAQDEAKVSNFNVGADIYSNYIWRGSKLGTGPAFQPTVKYVKGGLTIGVWGSFDGHGYAEADPYISYSMPFGLSLGLTDYYYPGLPVFEISDTAGSHALEINAGFTKGGLTLSANYIVNQAGGAASAGGDKYFQAGYAFSTFNIFVGAGDGWHTSDGKFAVCNIGLGTSKTIKLTETFSVPVTGQVILNPEKEQLFLVVGFSF